MTESASAIPQEKPQEEKPFTLWQRFVIWVATWAGFVAIRLIAPTLRYTVSVEDGGPPEGHLRPAIYVFWHRCVFIATWHFRAKEIAVMTSRSFDGEYIARIIEKFGYSAVRGSSSRGAVRALLGMHKVIDVGRTVAFTIDGPRGPKYVAKPGPVLLARNTGVPIMAFHIALENPWILPSWDDFMIPKPFSRALVRIGKLIHVPEDADSAALERHHADMQATLDRIREFAEAEVGRESGGRRQEGA
ncbi:MAG: lysophospholipid acyltransferase family protein [Terriglobales bacterium]